jgi:hypothetical protein
MQLSSLHPNDHQSNVRAIDVAEPSVSPAVQRKIPLLVPLAAVLLLIASAMVWYFAL